MPSDPKTPAERTVEARDTLETMIGMHPLQRAAYNVDVALDVYTRACIDEAVAPAVEYIDTVKDALCLADVDVFMFVRKLLTGRAGT